MKPDAREFTDQKFRHYFDRSNLLVLIFKSKVRGFRTFIFLLMHAVKETGFFPMHEAIHIVLTQKF